MKSLVHPFIYSAVALIFIAGCTSETITDPELCDNSLELNIDDLLDTACGVSEGSVTLLATGGTGPYTYTLNNVTNETGSFNDLASGNYSAEVTDANGCKANADVEIKNTDGVNIEVVVNDTECGESTGMISITASGGVTPYSFSIDNGTPQGEASFDDLAPGEYSIIAQDANGCETSETVKVLSDAAFTDVRSIITTNCAISGCHDGSRSPNLTSDNGIQNSAERIKARTTARSMPPSSSGRSLTAEQIELIACWVDDGAIIN